MGVLTDLVNYMRENFEKKYAAEIEKGTYDDRDLKKVREDFNFVRSFIRGEDRLDEGVELMHESLKFRKEVSMNDIHEFYFERELWDIGGMYFRNKDIEGRRILWLRVKFHNKNAGAERLFKEKQALVWGLERAFIENPLKPVVVMLDMSSCGLSNLDLDFVKYIITVFKYYYPTFLGNMLIYDMPWIFNAAWKVVKAWLSAEAAAKIRFVTKSDIQTYIKKESLPLWMGGADDWVYEYYPGVTNQLMYPEEVEEHNMRNQKNEKKVTFKEAKEPNDTSPISELDHNANSSSTLRNRMPNGTALNRNNNANERLSMVLGGSKPSAGHNTFVGRFLTVSPSHELTFRSQTRGDSFDVISLSNTLTYPVAYKVKTTSPEKFRVRPSAGVIHPHKTEEVYVYVVQDSTPQAGKDKFLIMATEVKQGGSNDPNQLLRDATKDQIMQHKLVCSEDAARTETSLSAVRKDPLLSKNLIGQRSKVEYEMYGGQPVDDEDIDKQVEQLEQQTMHMQRQLNLLLIVQLLTAFTLIILMLSYSCMGEELFTRFLALPFDFCNDPYGRKC